MPTTEVSVRLPNSISLWMPCSWCGDRGVRPGHALRPGRAAQPRAGQADQAAGDDDADLEHEVGDQHRTQQGAGGAAGGGLDLGARGGGRGGHPPRVGRPHGSPCRGACGPSRSTGRCARRGRWRPPPRPPARAGGRRPGARARRPPAGRHRAHPRAARRPGATGPPGAGCGDDDTPEDEQGHPEQVGDGEHGLGAQDPGQQQGERDEGRSCRPAANTAPPDEPGPGRVPAERQAQGAEDDQLHDLDGEDGDRLGAEQAAAAERGRPEQAQHAVPAVEARGDGLAGERGGDDRQGEDARAPTRSIRRPGPRLGEEVIARPSRAAQGSTRATSSCSPLRRRVPVSKRAWAATRRAAGAAALIGRPPGQREVDVLEAAGAAHLGDRPLGDDGPAVDDDDEVGEALGLLEGVGGQDDGAPGRAGLAHQVPHVEAGLRVQAGGGLVQEARPAGRPTRAAASATRCRWPPESRRTVVPANAVDAEPGHQVVDGGGRGVQGGEVAQQPDRRVPLGRPPSCSITPTRARWSASARQGSRAQHADGPAVGAPQPLAALDRGGLAGAVRAEDGGDLPGRADQVEPVDRATGRRGQRAHERRRTVTAWSTPRSLGRPRG